MAYSKAIVDDFLVPWQGEPKDSKDSERGFAGNSGI